ncbi:MAG: UDP-N-acetylglucosamine 2-epimerase (non-hydrolyzing) [Flavobacteriales bacterium]|nr:UDP-N-acetylglucosamine 2-epimerase (non-hydrolyzing) [Flavobacteriales bacterium]
MKVLTVVGARPQFIKAAALSRAIRSMKPGLFQEDMLHTGQHYDANMSTDLFSELGLPGPKYRLNVGSAPHAQQTGAMMAGIEEVLRSTNYDALLVYGDTNSTLAGALVGSKMGIPIAHVEAGLRSFDRGMPEEVNRVLTDHCSTWLFCPTRTAVANLEREGIIGRQGGSPSADHPAVLSVGDVMYDNSLHFAARAEEQGPEVLGIPPDLPFALLTMHRPQNTDDPLRLERIIDAANSIHERYGLEIVFPMHPRTRQRMLEPGSLSLTAKMKGPGWRSIDPVGFFHMAALEKRARLVLTDSGGVQKEAFFHGTPCVVLRPGTEWVELVQSGHAALGDADPDVILSAADRFLKDPLPPRPDLFGDGRASERIVKALLGERVP